MVCVGHTGRHCRKSEDTPYTHTHSEQQMSWVWCKWFGLFSVCAYDRWLTPLPLPFSLFTSSSGPITTQSHHFPFAKDRNASPNGNGLLRPLEFSVCLPRVLWQVRERSLPGVSHHRDADSSGGWLFVPLSFSFYSTHAEKDKPSCPAG